MSRNAPCDKTLHNTRFLYILVYFFFFFFKGATYLCLRVSQNQYLSFDIASRSFRHTHTTQWTKLLPKYATKLFTHFHGDGARNASWERESCLPKRRIAGRHVHGAAALHLPQFQAFSVHWLMLYMGEYESCGGTESDSGSPGDKYHDK